MRHQGFMRHELFGAIVLPGTADYCSMGKDHFALVEEAREARRKLEKDIDSSSVICARCVRAIPLKV
jgi:hypothetical protein